MRNQLFTRTTVTAAIIAIAMLMTLALLTTPGNKAQGQSVPSVAFTETSIELDEPDNSPYRANAVLTVRLSQASSQTVTVQYRTEDFTATATTGDYIAASGTLYFYPGTTERTISVTVLDDTAVEANERFYIQLTSPTDAVLGSNKLAQVNIRDADESAPFNLTVPETVREGQGTFTIVIEAANPPAVEHALSFAVFSISGSALQNYDFEPFEAYAEWGDGTNRREFEVTLIDDTTDEPNETFEIKMSRTQQEFQFVMGVTQQTVTILDDDPGTPTNLELADQTTDPDLGHVAVLQWDYEDAEGYLLESRDGTSGPWNCIVAGTYSSREPTGTSTVSTTKGGAMTASEDWHFQVRNFNSEEFSYPGEATCDSSAEYGYIFSTVDDQGYNLSPADTLGPVAIPAIDPTVRPTWQPTGLTIAAGAKHRDVNISWDTPPDGSNVTGFALYRKWQGESNTPHLCLYWSTKSSEFITSYRDTHVAAYDDAGNKNKYVYKVYPLNAAVPQNLSAPGGCDDYRPGDMQPQVSVTATLTLSTDIFPNSDGDLEYLNPPAPTGLTLETRFRGYRRDISTIIARWEDVENAPGYKVRWRETSETDWRERGRSRTLEPGANACSDGTILSTLNDGRVWCIRENGKLLTTTVTPWPWMFNAGPGKPNDNIAPARKGFGFLESGVRHEVQVATCTDQSCDNTGAWSTSRYTYAR